MQHEKTNDILNIYSNCVASCANSHIINLLYGRKFANVNLTQSKLAKSLHLKIGAKVIKKLNTNKLLTKKYAKVMLLLIKNGKVECPINRKDCYYLDDKEHDVCQYKKEFIKERVKYKETYIYICYINCNFQNTNKQLKLF